MYEAPKANLLINLANVAATSQGGNAGEDIVLPEV